MALDKKDLPISFSQGLDLKTDPKQVPFGKFLDLQNSIFHKTGLLSKRNGYGALAPLPRTATFATTFNGNLTAVGTSFFAYSRGSATWVNKGPIQPLLLDTLPLVRSNTNQTQADCAIAANGLICTVFTDRIPSGGTTVASYKYAIADSATGQNIVSPTAIPVSSGVVTGSPRVFLLGNFFVIVFSNNIGGTYHLQYIAVNVTDPTQVTAESDLSAQYTPATTVAWDGVVANNSLYVAWNGSGGGGEIKVTYLDSTLTQHNTVTFAGHSATIMSVTADISQSTPVIYCTFYNSVTSTGYVLAVGPDLTTILAQTLIISATTVLNICSSATAQNCVVFYEVSNNYSYDASIPTHYVSSVSISQAGSVTITNIIARSVGLASKSCIINTQNYFLGIYQSAYQPTCFLFNAQGQVTAKLAYSNSGPYYTTGLPSIVTSGNVAQFPYLIKDLIAPANKAQGAANTTPVYSQTGINLATVTIGTSEISVAEIGSNLNLSGGFLWSYDGYTAVEQGFHLWPDDVEVTVANAGGNLSTQDYFYVATYEWADNQGNVFRSAPSIPVKASAADFSGSANEVTVDIPTLRLTYKTANPVKIVVYRWSTAQQTYFQTTSLTVPLLNDTTVDSVQFVDTNADASIIGNSILYTTGGVLENIGAPACSDASLFKSRVFLVDAENKNLLWFSKQVVEATPVEMSDDLTQYIAPTTGAQGSTGGMRYTFPMDDKLILFKKDAAYYIVGNGPDNTGANNDFSEPVFITSTVGSENKRSVAVIPKGLMFQAAAGKGIWLLGRDLSTSYIGAPVADYNSFNVNSAVNVPGTNQVRFTLSNGKVLMYDYYYEQWGTFTNVAAISSTVYQGLHTFINARGEVYQETPGSYLDGSRPVLMSFKTGWINLAGLQGFERAYWLYFIGEYLTPHNLSIAIAYDYAPGPEQTVSITPENVSSFYGSADYYGDDQFGGTASLEQWQVYFQRQKCQAFQIQLDESYDSTQGVPAGAGFTLSGLLLTVGTKGTSPKLKSALSVG